MGPHLTEAPASGTESDRGVLVTNDKYMPDRLKIRLSEAETPLLDHHVFVVDA
jgi:hypothetical protein